ncbi:MAG: GTPase HflX, partial [Pseudomonadota bacterium]
DTVGFISDLPTELVASFRATLEEVLAADVILHVRDISHPETEAQAEDVRTILTDLGVDAERALFEVWNKVDLLPDAEAEAVRARAERDDNVLALSAITGEGLEALLSVVAETLQGAVSEETLLLPYADGRKRAWLFEQDVVLAERQGEDGFEFDVRWTAIQKARFDGL